MEEKYLILVTINNSNKECRLIPSEDGKTFTMITGRIGGDKKSEKHPAKDWDVCYNAMIKRGYVDKSDINKKKGNTEAEDKKGYSFKEIMSKEVKRIVDFLQECARQTIKKNYKIGANEATPEMIAEAQELLNALTVETDKVKFNRILLKLFEALPREMTNVISYTARTNDEMGGIIQREADLLDVMKGAIDTNGKILATQNNCSGTILDALGISFEECSQEEKEMVKNHMDSNTRNRFGTCWKVRNLKQEIAFQNYLKRNKISQTKFFYHGSRSENWWSIINTNLKCNPQNAVITGKMFGYGIYFAPKAQKSAGYTSVQGARWTGGTKATGYLGVYEVAYGNPYNVQTWSGGMSSMNEKKLKSLGNYDCLHAHAGSSLVNDEVIVYNDNAASIRYLIELH